MTEKESFHSFQLGCKPHLRPGRGKGELVSIPFSQAANTGIFSVPPLVVYRFHSFQLGCKRIADLTVFPTSSSVSIPFSQAANTAASLRSFSRSPSFHSFQLGCKREMQLGAASCICGFHSFQLGCKLFHLIVTVETNQKFPFLLVRLQTLGKIERVEKDRIGFHSFQLGCKPVLYQHEPAIRCSQFPFLLVRLQTRLVPA